MISGTQQQPNDYYGYSPLPTPSIKQIRRMKRTQLSNQKKSNHSVKSINSQKDSSLSKPKTRRSLNNNNSIIKNNYTSSLKDSQSKYTDNLPSSTDIQSTNNGSIRKSRLQINTGVIGIKMDSLSPTTVLSHPSKVLFVNQSSSGKKGSKTKKQKSILYVEYNNFMTQMNNSKSNKKSRSKDQTLNSKLDSKYNSNKNQQSPNKKKRQSQQFSNVLPSNLDNQYFAGLSRNCLSPILPRKDQPNKNQHKGLLGLINKNVNSESNQVKNIQSIQSSRKQSSKIQTPRNDNKNLLSPKNQASIGNLSITSTAGNKLQSPKIFALSPKVARTQQEKSGFKNHKNKISIHQITALRQKSQQKNPQSNQVRQSRNSVRSNETKVQSYGIQVNIAQNLISQSIKKIIPQMKQINIEANQQYFQRPGKQQVPSSQKTIKYSESSNQKQYKTQKQLAIAKNQKPLNIQKTNKINNQNKQGYVNPYNLTKNQNLVNHYQKKKVQSQFMNLVQQVKSKAQKRPYSKEKQIQTHIDSDDNYTKLRQNNLQSQVSESIVSQQSSKRSRKLVKFGQQKSKNLGQKIILKSSAKSKLKLPASPLKPERSNIFQPKTPQPYSNYKNSQVSSSQESKNSHNQYKRQSNFQSNLQSVNYEESKVYNMKQSTKKINKIDDYNDAYYTPNPYSSKKLIQSRTKNNLNFVPQDDKSSIVSQLQSQNSDLQNFEMNSQASSMQSNDDNLSLKSGKSRISNISSASKLKRQQIARKSQLRLSRNSYKSNKSNSTKKISLNPVSKINQSLQNSSHQEQLESLNTSKYSEKPKTKMMDYSNKMMKDEGKQFLQKAQQKVVINKIQSKSPQLISNSSNKQIKFLRVNKNIDSQNSLNNISKTSQRSPQKINTNAIQNTKKQENEYNLQSKLNKSIKNNQINKSLRLNQSKKQIKATSIYQSKHSLKPEIQNSKKIQKIKQLSKYSQSQRQSQFSNQQSLQTTKYKNQLAVQNVQSQIQSFPAQINNKLTDTIKSKPQSISNTKRPVNQPFNIKQTINNSKTPHQQIKNNQQSQSQLQKSNYSIKSLQRSGKRLSIKNSIHPNSKPNLQSSMMASRHGKSNLTIKSGRNLKPFSLQNPKIQQFIQYIDEYDIAIGFLYLYVQNTSIFYCSQNQQKSSPQVEQFRNRINNLKSKKYEEKYEKLAFLMMKKYLYEKNRVIKCLRGIQSNVFTLTGLQIPDKILKKFINHQKTKQKLKQFQLQTKQLFKKLEQQFRSLRLKADNKKDKLIKIQTPYDNITRDIVEMLMEQLNQLTAQIDEMQIQTGSKLSLSNPSLPLKGGKVAQKSLTSVIAQQILSSEQRGVQVMELVFLLAELQSRKTKKLQLLNIGDIDFEVYYENYIDKLLQTYEYFEKIKYPSDEVPKNKG